MNKGADIFVLDRQTPVDHFVRIFLLIELEFLSKILVDAIQNVFADGTNFTFTRVDKATRILLIKIVFVVFQCDEGWRFGD